jgi:uncharacterized membrane protein YfcA
MWNVEAVIFVLIAQMLGYVVKGLTGFGNPLISAPLLSMRLDNAIITPGTLLLDAPINAFIAWRKRDQFQWQKIVPILLAVLAGVVPGVLLLKMSFPWVLKAVLGILVLVLGIEMATRNRRSHKKQQKQWVGLLVAFVSGICAGLFGINMLIIAYLERTTRNYDEFKGSMCFLFLVENLFRMAAYLMSGLITMDVLILGAITVPAAILGVSAGSVLSKHLPEQRMRQCVVVLFLLSGISIFIKAVVFRT